MVSIFLGLPLKVECSPHADNLLLLGQMVGVGSVVKALDVSGSAGSEVVLGAARGRQVIVSAGELGDPNGELPGRNGHSIGLGSEGEGQIVAIIADIKIHYKR